MHRRSTVNWTILLGSLALLLCSTAQCIYRLTLPTDGWTWTSGAVGTSGEDTITFDSNIYGASSPLMPGDFLLAVESHPYKELMDNALTGQRPMISDWRAGTTVRYLVQRGNATVTLDVPLYHWQLTHIAQLILRNVWLFVHLLGVGVSGFVFYRRPTEFAARVLFLLNAVSLAVAISDTLTWGVPEIVNPPARAVSKSAPYSERTTKQIECFRQRCRIGA